MPCNQASPCGPGPHDNLGVLDCKLGAKEAYGLAWSFLGQMGWPLYPAYVQLTVYSDIGIRRDMERHGALSNIKRIWHCVCRFRAPLTSILW